MFHKLSGISWGHEARFVRKDSDPWNYLRHCAACCTNSTWQHFASGLKHKVALKVSSHQKMTTPALCLVLMFLSPVRATPISSWQLRPWHHPSCRASEDGQPLHYLSMKCWPTLVSCTLPLSAIMLWTGHCTLLICFTLRHCSTRTHNTPSFFVVQFWGASSPLCWYNNTEILCIDFQSNTTIFHLVQWENTTTTCFGPIGRRSSGCNLDLEISFTRCVCVGGGENEISLFPYWVPWPRVFC